MPRHDTTIPRFQTVRPTPANDTRPDVIEKLRERSAMRKGLADALADIISEHVPAFVLGVALGLAMIAVPALVLTWGAL